MNQDSFESNNIFDVNEYFSKVTGFKLGQQKNLH